MSEPIKIRKAPCYKCSHRVVNGDYNCHSDCPLYANYHNNRFTIWENRFAERKLSTETPAKRAAVKAKLMERR